MSTPGLESMAPQPSTPVVRSSLRRHIEEGVLVLLVVLCALGVAINDYSPKSAFTYWLWMTPTFGVVTVFAAWLRAHRRAESVPAAVQRQVLHWLGVAGAVFLVYKLQSTGRMTNEAAGLTAVTVLGLAAFLAGVYSDWRLSLVGIVLGFTVFAFALLEEYFIWVVVLPAMLLIIVGTIVYARRSSSSPVSSSANGGG
jgi:hypothetical protein